MIELKGITREFDFKVLDNIDYIFKPGKMYVLKGISGSGKTTLFNIISGLDKKYEGEILYNGEDLKRMKNKDRKYYEKTIGYILQESLLIHHMTVKENLLFIENNPSKIENMAKTFDVDSLLNKYPKQLSGGERQRISLIRALLGNTKIIIADEPTSSLDKENSIIFSRVLQELRDAEKLILIATHKNIYDSIADETIEIENGKITSIKKNERRLEKSISKISEDKKAKSSFNLKQNIKYICSRKNNQKSNSWIFLLACLFFIVFFSLSIKMNFQDEYVKIKAKTYPYNVLSVIEKDYLYLKDLITKKYEEYKVYEDNFTGYVLPEWEDSNFKIPGTISYGSFPTNKNQILVNREYINVVFPKEDIEKVVGQTVKIKNQLFKISGIIEKTDDNYYEVYGCNSYYNEINRGNKNDISKPAVFINYELIEKIGTKIAGIQESPKLVVINSSYVDDLYNGNIFSEKNEPIAGNYRSWKNRIDIVVKDATFLSNMALILMVFIAIISILFVGNQISLDLFYRKKEIGYLQLFRISKSRIAFVFIGHYLTDIIKGLLLSLVSIISISIFAYYLWGINFIMPINYIIYTITVIIIYSLLVILMPLLVYLKKDILKLIRDY